MYTPAVYLQKSFHCALSLDFILVTVSNFLLQHKLMLSLISRYFFALVAINLKCLEQLHNLAKRCLVITKNLIQI